MKIIKVTEEEIIISTKESFLFFSLPLKLEEENKLFVSELYKNYINENDPYKYIMETDMLDINLEYVYLMKYVGTLYWPDYEEFVNISKMYCEETNQRFFDKESLILKMKKYTIFISDVINSEGAVKFNVVITDVKTGNDIIEKYKNHYRNKGDVATILGIATYAYYNYKNKALSACKNGSILELICKINLAYRKSINSAF